MLATATAPNVRTRANHTINEVIPHTSHKSKQIDYHSLAQNMRYLQDELGCHNINFVSPSHFVPQLDSEYPNEQINSLYFDTEDLDEHLKSSPEAAVRTLFSYLTVRTYWISA